MLLGLETKLCSSLSRSCCRIDRGQNTRLIDAEGNGEGAVGFDWGEATSGETAVAGFSDGKISVLFSA